VSPFNNPLHSASADGDLNTYKAIRAASKTWFEKIMRHPARPHFDMVKAARNVGIDVEGNTIIFEDECESAVLMDNLLCDYRPGQNSLVESCVFEAGALAPLEAGWHQALVASRTSLFAVTEINFAASQILLRDLLLPAAPDFWITDIGFAQSFHHNKIKPLVFTRVVSLRDIHLTGGFSFLFEAKHQDKLVEGYHEAFGMTTPAQAERRRTRHFLRQNRQLGEPQAYADVAPPSA
jgi:hypothetical protein